VTKGKKEAKKPQEKKHMEKMVMKPQDEHRIHKMTKEGQDFKMANTPHGKYIKAAAAQKQALLSKKRKEIMVKNVQNKKPESDVGAGRVRALMEFDISSTAPAIVVSWGRRERRPKRPRRSNEENLRAVVTLDDLLSGVLEHNKYNLPRQWTRTVEMLPSRFIFFLTLSRFVSISLLFFFFV
jgi:hypothetical protein